MGKGPDFLHSMNDELRVVKCERKSLQDRMKIMERNSLLNTEQMLRLQENNNKLSSLLYLLYQLKIYYRKSKKMQNAGQMRNSLNNLSSEVSMREQEVSELQRTIVHVENEKAMEIKQWKTRYGKIMRAQNELKSDHEDLQAVLKVFCDRANIFRIRRERSLLYPSIVFLLLDLRIQRHCCIINRDLMICRRNQILLMK
jgi:hypothetical protein